VGVFVARFGELNKGFHTWRVHGSQMELEHLLNELKTEGAIYKTGAAPQIERVHRNEYTILLEIEINEGAAANDYGQINPPNGDDIKQKIH